MWIEADRAGEGLGRLLLEEVARRLEAEGVEWLVLHSRKPVIGFYRKCGFLEEGPEFSEVGIPHREMKRRLNPERRSPGCHQ
jgi:predicted GNAT family N-acyltransferase